MSVEIFFCYAHKDRTLRNELEKHLSPLKRSEEHTTITWHDRKILPGMDWDHEIDIHLNSADIVLLLVSADFINSDYCYSVEMHQALDRHREGKAHVIPIILRPVDWQKTPIGDLQVLPEDGRPITKWRNRDEAFLNVARRVYEVIRSIPLSTTKQEFDSLLPENLQALQDILRERLYTLLETLNPKLRSDVQYVLEAKGKLLSQTQTDTDPQDSTLPAGTWQLLTLLVAQHISPNIDPVLASSVAVAIECFVCALELLDDIEDENQTPVVQVLGSARTLNVSATLLMLTQRTILSLSQQGIASERIVSLLDTIQESALVATTGQHQDLLAEQGSALDFTPEECIYIAACKAGALTRLALRLGALCAGASEAVREQFSEVGLMLGIFHQLDNDSHDLYDLLQDVIPAILPRDARATPGSEKSDLVRGKKTLPIVLAAAEIAKTRGTTDVNLKDVLQKIAEFSDEKSNDYLLALKEGILTTWGISLLYRERIRDHLQEIEASKPIAPSLRILLGFDTR